MPTKMSSGNLPVPLINSFNFFIVSYKKTILLALVQIIITILNNFKKKHGCGQIIQTNQLFKK
jgi:hypothetical protein